MSSLSVTSNSFVGGPSQILPSSSHGNTVETSPTDVQTLELSPVSSKPADRSSALPTTEEVSRDFSAILTSFNSTIGATIPQNFTEAKEFLKKINSSERAKGGLLLSHAATKDTNAAFTATEVITVAGELDRIISLMSRSTLVERAIVEVALLEKQTPPNTTEIEKLRSWIGEEQKSLKKERKELLLDNLPLAPSLTKNILSYISSVAPAALAASSIGAGGIAVAMGVYDLHKSVKEKSTLKVRQEELKVSQEAVRGNIAKFEKCDAKAKEESKDKFETFITNLKAECKDDLEDIKKALTAKGFDTKDIQTLEDLSKIDGQYIRLAVVPSEEIKLKAGAIAAAKIDLNKGFFLFKRLRKVFSIQAGIAGIVLAGLQVAGVLAGAAIAASGFGMIGVAVLGLGLSLYYTARYHPNALKTKLSISYVKHLTQNIRLSFRELQQQSSIKKIRQMQLKSQTDILQISSAIGGETSVNDLRAKLETLPKHLRATLESFLEEQGKGTAIIDSKQVFAQVEAYWEGKMSAFIAKANEQEGKIQSLESKMAEMKSTLKQARAKDAVIQLANLGISVDDQMKKLPEQLSKLLAFPEQMTPEMHQLIEGDLGIHLDSLPKDIEGSKKVIEEALQSFMGLTTGELVKRMKKK